MLASVSGVAALAVLVAAVALWLVDRPHRVLGVAAVVAVLVHIVAVLKLPPSWLGVFAALVLFAVAVVHGRWHVWLSIAAVSTAWIHAVRVRHLVHDPVWAWCFAGLGCVAVVAVMCWWADRSG